MKNKRFLKGVALALAMSTVGIIGTSYADSEKAPDSAVNDQVDAVSGADEKSTNLVEKKEKLRSIVGQIKDSNKRKEFEKKIENAKDIDALDKLEKEINDFTKKGNDKVDDKKTKDEQKTSTFDELKKKAIDDIIAHKDALTPEAQKDGIKEILKTKNEEELKIALANFNPQGPIDQYPTTAKKYSLKQVGNGHTLVIDGYNFESDPSGNLALDRNYTKEIPKFDLAVSELNAFITKYVSNQSNLSLVNQAIIENQIDEFEKQKKNKNLDPIAVIQKHIQLNATILENSTFKYKDALNEDAKTLNQLIEDIKSGKVASEQKVDSTKKPNNVKKNNDSHNKKSEKTQKANKAPAKKAGTNAETGIIGIAGVSSILLAAAVAYNEMKKINKK